MYFIEKEDEEKEKEKKTPSCTLLRRAFRTKKWMESNSVEFPPQMV